jgi:tetratricopeptide (TPR) repeat protein
MHYTVIFAASLAALLALDACTAGMVKEGMVKDCEQDRNWNLKISGCTAMIDSGQYSGRNLALAYNNRGNTYIELGEYSRAIEDFDQAVRLVPNNAIPYTGRGDAYGELGQRARAIEDYDKAVQLDPGYSLAFSNRGVEYAALGDYARAIEDFDQALRLDPGDASFYNNRAFARCFLGQIEPAHEDWMQGIRLGAGAAEATQSILQDRGFYKGAIDGDFDLASEKALREWTIAGCPT